MTKDKNTQNTKAKSDKEGKPKSKKPFIIGGIIALVILIIGIVCISASNSKVEPIYDESGKPVYVSEDNLKDIYSNPSAYEGKFVKMTGKVFNKLTQDGSTILQVYTDIDNLDKSTALFIEGASDINENDFVKFTGYVDELAHYQNSFGGFMSTVAIVVKDVDKIDYKEAARPTTRELKFKDEAYYQGDYEVSLDKVEFSKEETRVYISATNESSYDFTLYTYSAAIVQDGQQFDQASVYHEYYPKLSENLKPGVKSSGVLVFPPIKEKDFEFIIGGSSSDWEFDMDDWEFDVEVEKED